MILIIVLAPSARQISQGRLIEFGRLAPARASGVSNLTLFIVGLHLVV